jgi:hypothetical protein
MTSRLAPNSTLQEAEPYGDGIEEELKRRGLQYRGTAKTSFQVKDPEGMGVQFGGLHQ